MALDVQLTWPALPIKLALRNQRPFTRRMTAVAGELRQSGSVPDLKLRTEPVWRAGSPFSAQAFASAGA